MYDIDDYRVEALAIPVPCHGHIKVAVVGAGAAGATAAAVLAASGIHVTVFEKQSVVGGRAGHVILGGDRCVRQAVM